jgi:hypothetical protein
MFLQRAASLFTLTSSRRFRPAAYLHSMTPQKEKSPRQTRAQKKQTGRILVSLGELFRSVVCEAPHFCGHYRIVSERQEQTAKAAHSSAAELKHECLENSKTALDRADFVKHVPQFPKLDAAPPAVRLIAKRSLLKSRITWNSFAKQFEPSSTFFVFEVAFEVCIPENRVSTSRDSHALPFDTRRL